MNVYYVAGIPYSDELYHHGIKGQKWGVRRYQNADGTLTAEGKSRYGNTLGQYKNDSGLIRKLATGDWALGKKRGGERREKRLEKKIEKAKAKGSDKNKIDKLEVKYEAQKQRNIARDQYNSSHRTGVLVAQKLLLGRSGSDSYRVARQRGAGIAEAALPSLFEAWSGIPVSTAISAKTVEGDIRRSRNK